MSLELASIHFVSACLQGAFVAFGASFFVENNFWIYFFCLIIVIPVLLQDELREFSYAACLFCVTVLASVIGILIGLCSKNNQATTNTIDFKNTNWEYLPEYIGMISFCLGGVTMIIPIRSTMKQPHKFRTIFKSSFIIVSIIFYMLGIFATFSYGIFIKFKQNRLEIRQDNVPQF